LIFSILNLLGKPGSIEYWKSLSATIAIGIPLSGIRAGIIGDIGVSEPFTKNEKKVCRAAARAQLETGAPQLIHSRRS